MTELFLIRHGQSANNALPEPQRVSDPGLTAIGQQQAQRTAVFLKEARPTHLYCSPFLRSLETTLPAAEATGLRPMIHSEIFEQGGCYSGYPAIGVRTELGMGATELARRFPGWEIDERIGPSGWWLNDFEQIDQANLRAQRIAGWITEKLIGQGGRHALIIHADFKFLLLAAILSPTDPPERVEIGAPLYNTGISRLLWTGTKWNHQLINSVAHLPPDLVTC